MNPKLFATFLLVVLLTNVLVIAAFSSGAFSGTAPDLYFGVYIGYGNMPEAKALMDRVSNFTNFFVVGTTYIAASFDENKTLEYAYSKGLYFMSLEASLGKDWYKFANDTWGNVVGFIELYEDEPGGRALDNPANSTVGWDANCLPTSPENATAIFKDHLGRALNNTRSARFGQMNYSLFAADYGLYWFDYKAGYDGVLAEFYGNYSRQMTVALARGAATVQNKTWGVLINWKYDEAPYLESAQDLYDDMLYAYNAGAKYIVIFDSNKQWTQDILTQDHLNAMQQFWDYVQTHPRQTDWATTRTAFVLPPYYGCGFRGPNDKIWGIWPQNDTSVVINAAMNQQLQLHGDSLDIIYDDDLESGNNYGYNQLIYWDDPNAQPTPSPSPSPSPTPTPSPSPTPTASPSPTTTPAPTFSPSPPSTLSPSNSPTPAISPSPDSGFFSSMDFVYLVAAAAIVTVAVVGVVLALRKRSAIAPQ
jgi:hypothetical protein